MLHLPRTRRWAKYRESTHGTLAAQGSPDAPLCQDCHSPHGTLGKLDPASPTFSRNVPTLCAKCHQEGHKAAVRYSGKQNHIVDRYRESIHGQGLLQAGLTVTANCADCHTPHHELPSRDPRSSVNRANIAETCAQCHRGIYELFTASVHSPNVTHSGKPLPVCADCHSAHSIERTDLSDFRLNIMDQCGRCHQQITAAYFETFHGKVSKLGYLQNRQVLRLSWSARHSAGQRSALASQPEQHRGHVRQVPYRLPPPVRRLSDTRHPPRSEEVSFPLRHLLGHDRPC